MTTLEQLFLNNTYSPLLNLKEFNMDISKLISENQLWFEQGAFYYFPLIYFLFFFVLPIVLFLVTRNKKLFIGQTVLLILSIIFISHIESIKDENQLKIQKTINSLNYDNPTLIKNISAGTLEYQYKYSHKDSPLIYKDKVKLNIEDFSQANASLKKNNETYYCEIQLIPINSNKKTVTLNLLRFHNIIECNK